MHLRPRTLLAVSLVVLLALTSCGDEGDGGGDAAAVSRAPDGTIDVVGADATEASDAALVALFTTTAEGAGVRFEESYGVSGDQSRAVEQGRKADVVLFSQERDVTRLVEAGLVAEDWDAGENRGIVSRSVVVFVVPEGNPEGVEDWDDLTKDGVAVVTPNPRSSNEGRWNALAAYGQVLFDEDADQEAEAYLADLFEHVVALPGSGRAALAAFESGTGDVLLASESEAIVARQGGAEIDYVLPPESVQIENPGAVVTGADPAAREWLAFLAGTEGQFAFAQRGFRPEDGLVTGVVEGANDPSMPYPRLPRSLFGVSDLGGWAAVDQMLFDEDDGMIPRIQEETGATG